MHTFLSYAFPLLFHNLRSIQVSRIRIKSNSNEWTNLQYRWSGAKTSYTQFILPQTLSHGHFEREQVEKKVPANSQKHD